MINHIFMNRDYSTAMRNQFSITGNKPGGALRTWSTKCRSSSTSVYVGLCASDGQSASITKNSCETSGRSPSLLPSRTEGGNGSYIHYVKSRPASPAKPWKKEKEKRKTSLSRDMKFASRAKDHQHDLAERSRRRKIRIRIPRGNKEEYVSNRDSCFIYCQNVFFCYGTKTQKAFCLHNLFKNTCLFRVWVAN